MTTRILNIPLRNLDIFFALALVLLILALPEAALARDIAGGVKQMGLSAKSIGSDVLIIGAVALGGGILLGFPSFGQAVAKWIFGACFILGASAWVSTAQNWFGRG